MGFDRLADMAGLLQLTLPCYRDLEDYPDEILIYSARDIIKWCVVLERSPSWFFGTSPPIISPLQIRELVQCYVTSQSQTLEQFEDEIGWYLHDFMDSPVDYLLENSFALTCEMADHLKFEAIGLLQFFYDDQAGLNQTNTQAPSPIH